MATLLSQQENIRRDTAAADAARRRVKTPKPLALDIEAIERQYTDVDMVIEAGKAFTKTPLQKIMAALVSKTHGNSMLDQLDNEFLIGQVSKMPGGNLRLKMKTQAVCLLLERTTASILGGVYPFRPFDVLANKFCLDISNVDSDADTNLMLYRLFVLGCQPVYDTFRNVNLATGLISATWCVFFRSAKCPPALLVNGSVCDQVIFDNKLHPAHGNDAPFQSERLPFGFRSHHGIVLDTPSGTSPYHPSPVSPAPTRDAKSPTPRLSALSASPQRLAKVSVEPAAPTKPHVFSLRNSLEEEENKESQLDLRAQHGRPAATRQLVAIDLDDALSISTL
ncbi:unnamed protein product [Peronospora destructor]|uniref:Uncharacterized protein n=1 Tax=Peronospora destructor TaxID=86335 RepID=A0AAV0VI71_9STRA|nr:unnamed protein product [Peronospora destructor]